ncbi:MAG: Ig-like domain repeat protein [Akkermansiaceae bacterium]|nr:Ig-like domain repeat protein [Akkermansiaceae bacterium]MCF7731795.1 Ig-like domain repeat protein [Akkermansiaceae bacterium]
MKSISMLRIAGATVKRFALASMAGAAMVAGSVQAETATNIYPLGPQDGGTTVLPLTGGLLPWIAKGALPSGSILRSVSIDARLDSMAAGSDSWASDLSAYFDPTPEAPGTAALLQVGGYDPIGTVETKLSWGNGDEGPGTTVIATKTAGIDFPNTIDLGTVEVSLGNGYNEATWSGTITVEYDLPQPASIVAFGSSGNPAVIDQDAKTIAWTVPNGTNVTALAPTYTLSSGTCDKVSGGPATYDFTNPVSYTVTDTAPNPDVVNVYTVTVIVAPPGPPVVDYARWFDASGISDKVDGDPVTTWNDGSANAAHATVPAGNASPTFVADAGTETGLPAVYFPKNGGAGNSGALGFTRDSSIRTVFSVFKGNSFLLTDQNEYHFHRPGDDNPAEPLWAGYASDRIRGGTTWVNGELVNGETFNMPTDLHNGFNLVEVLATDSVQADGFNKDRVYHAGNQYQAEVIIYDRQLTEPERVSVERYLMHKWFNVFYGLAIVLDSPSSGQGFPTNSAVTATATVYNGLPPFTVQFYKKIGTGAFQTVGAAHQGNGPTFTQDLGTLANNNYAVYATVSDSTSPTPLTATCEPGNAFLVSAPIATTTTLATPAGPSTYGQSLTFTATVSGPPTGGTVQFYDNGVALGTPRPVNPSTGQATYTTTLLAAGTHPITAGYGGHDSYLASTAAAVSQGVAKAVLTVTADNKVRAPGASNPGLTYKVTDYQNGEDLGSSGVTGAPALSTSANTGSPEGFYPITCAIGNLAAANYSFALINGTLAVQAGAPPVSNGMVCWYDASTITEADGDQVNTWNDLSGNGHTATRASGAPVISYSDIKYDVNEAPKKGVHFRGTDDWFDCAAGMFVKEQYVVVRSPNPTWIGSGSFLARKSNDFLSVRASSHNLYNGFTGFWDDQLPAAVSKNGTVLSSGSGSMPRGGFELGPITDYMIVKIVVNENASAANRAAYPFYHIGRTETLSGVEMDIAEIIGYNATLSAGDEAVLGAYLAEKYGLPTDYPDTTPQALIRSFTVSGLPSTIDQARRKIVIDATIGSDVSTLVPTFTLSEGATCTVNGSLVVSGVTPVNFIGPPVHCLIKSSDSLITADYSVTVRYVSSVSNEITVLDVAADATGVDILNDGTLVAANHVGGGAVQPVTLANGLILETSTEHLTGYSTNAWGGGGQSTDTDAQNLVTTLDGTTELGSLMRSYIWSSVQSSHLDIPGLIPGHSYRLQWITTNPRGGNISVEESPSGPLTGSSDAPTVLTFTWIATDTTANALVTRQNNPHYGGGHDSEILFNGYALHDMGVAIPGAVISGVSASRSIPAGTSTVTLSGKVSNGSTAYPASGEAVAVTINGMTEYALIGSAGAFSINFPSASLVIGAYPITYSYAGNWITLAGAPDETSTTLSVSGPAVIGNLTPSPTRVVGSSIVTLSGTVSGGTAYPDDGELVQVTINGVTLDASIAGSEGAFSIEFPIASVPVGEHTIIYRYAGNGILLAAAPDDSSTKLMVVATAGTAYESLVLASGPVSYWPLNETSGTTAVDLVGTNNLTYDGTYTLNQEPLRNTDGQPCVLFTNSNTAVPYNSDLNPGQFTVECWVKPVDTTVQYLVSLQDRTAGGRIGYAIWKNNGSAGFGVMGGLDPSNNGVAVNGATVAAAGKTFHVVGTYDGTTLKLYVNGNFEGSAPLVYMPATVNQPGFSIGSRNGITAAPSYIQDVALYNRALTAQEILTHYQGSSSTAGYGDWAATYAGGQAANQDYNHDGVQNGIAYFMGENGLTTNPGVVAGKVSWKKAVNEAYAVKVSTDLETWVAAPGGSVAEVGGYVVYTLPYNVPRSFVRLEVIVP